jgi:flagellar basal body-associated protein FliL
MSQDQKMFAIIALVVVVIAVVIYFMSKKAATATPEIVQPVNPHPNPDKSHDPDDRPLKAGEKQP